MITLKEVKEKDIRNKPCVMCGEVDEDTGNHIIGYDKTDVDNILNEYYKEGDTLCGDCLFK